MFIEVHMYLDSGTWWAIDCASLSNKHCQKIIWDAGWRHIYDKISSEKKSGALITTYTGGPWHEARSIYDQELQ